MPVCVRISEKCWQFQSRLLCKALYSNDKNIGLLMSASLFRLHTHKQAASHVSNIRHIQCQLIVMENAHIFQCLKQKLCFSVNCSVSMVLKSITYYKVKVSTLQGSSLTAEPSKPVLFDYLTIFQFSYSKKNHTKERPDWHKNHRERDSVFRGGAVPCQCHRHLDEKRDQA